MALIQVENLTKSYGMKTLFDHIQFYINEGDSIGIVGVNGTGKSTLLKIIAGYEGMDEGKLTMAKATRIEYLSQSPVFDDDATVLEQVLKGDSSIFKTLRAYQRAVAKAEKDPENKANQEAVLQLTEAMTIADAWELESQVKTILTKLKITEFDKPINTLSGGQKKRVALAASLLATCDLLILDEPTNHMDSETIDWLEEYLARRKGALLMVTHDRYFLDRVCNRILEISHGACYSYEGNYTTYVTAKAERLELANVLEQRMQNIYRRELAWIRTGARGRGTKQKARIQRFDELKNQSFITEQEHVELLAGYTRMGKKTIILKDLEKGFGGKWLFKNLSYTFLPTDRLGIIGPNGAGKSTLLNIITGQLSQDSGTLEIGETLKIGYFSQEGKDMDTDLRGIDYIKETAEFITTESGDTLTASQMMERFMFTGEMQHAPIYSLSGGERRRLYLLKVLMDAPNVLILDEPTNDLDIDTLKVLENYIDDFNGIVITVSHDRYFLDRICNKMLSFEASGIVIHTGNYEDYMDYAKEQGIHQVQESKGKNETVLKEPPKKKQEVVKLKLTYKEQQDLKSLGGEIEVLEKALETLQEALEANQTDFMKLQELGETIEATENELIEKMERLETLEEKEAAILEQKQARQ
jgi:ATP-binding cassette subfamily F protein uup